MNNGRDEDPEDKRMLKRNGATIPANRRNGTGDSASASFCFIAPYGVELSVLFYSIGTTNYQIAVQNFYIDRICHVDKNLSWGECHNLTSSSYANDEKSIEVAASEYQIYQNLIEFGFPILLSFFVGSWTDKNGSKPVLTTALFGYFLTCLLYIGFSYLPDVDPHYILISSLPLGLGGGLTALLISACSFITRECPSQDRSWRLGVLSICFDGGATIGYFMGEKIYGLLGYTEVFITSAFLLGMALICAVFLIYEKKPENRLVESSHGCSSLKEFFDIDAVKETVITCFKRRQNRRRRYILILMTAISLQYLSFSIKTYTYLFTRNKFAWNLKDFSDFSVVSSLLNNVGGLLMTFVAIKLLHIPDVYLGLISSLSNLSGYLVTFFATSGWLMYLGYGVQMLGAITTAIIRSILSKLVDPEEHGKLFSFVTCLEMSMPFVAGPLYGILYMNTAMTLPSAIFLVPIGINVINSLFYLYMNLTMENFIVHSPLREDGHN